MKQRNFFWGLLFLFGGVLVVLGQFDFFEFSMFRLICSVFLIMVAITSIPRRNFFAVIMPIVLVIWINRELIHLPDNRISLVTLIVAGVFISIGLSFIFGKRVQCKTNQYHYSYSGDTRQDTYTNEEYAHTTTSNGDDIVECKVSFASSAQYIHSTNLQKVTAECNLGRLQIFFEQAKPSQGGTDIFVDCSLGSLELFIPKYWNVRNNISASLGAVEEEHHSNQHAANDPIINLYGNVNLGAVKIVYV